MNLIVAVDQNWGIGNKNELLIRIPGDQRMFREKTTGNVVVLGRKTMETFPNGQPLKNRTNIVLTKNQDYNVEGAIVAHSVEEVLKETANFDSDDIYIIGGESIYRQFLPYCDTAYVTKINRKYEADAFFPNLDKEIGWKITQESEEQTYFDTEYTFLKYEK